MSKGQSGGDPKMRIGLLGASRIAPRAIIEPAGELANVEVAAVAARDVSRAESFAAAHRIPRVHSTYEQLVNDGSLDAVYIGLPATLHAKWSIAALEAGRHVLCEKPFAANADQARTMVGTADRSGRHLVEAFHWRYHPLADMMIELSSKISPLVNGDGRFEMQSSAKGNIRFDLSLGGGATMDLGCYVIHWLRTLSAEEPEVMEAHATEGPAGVDVSMRSALTFPSGMNALLSCSMAGSATTFFDACLLHLQGRGGELTVHNPMAPQFGHKLTAHVADEGKIDEVLTAQSSYFYQLQAFVSIIEGQSEALTGGADSIANMAVIDAIYRASGLAVRH
jgi:predicted dehydrogenase